MFISFGPNYLFKNRNTRILLALKVVRVVGTRVTVCKIASSLVRFLI
jgi:hypothetical protein